MFLRNGDRICLKTDAGKYLTFWDKKGKNRLNAGVSKCLGAETFRIHKIGGGDIIKSGDQVAFSNQEDNIFLRAIDGGGDKIYLDADQIGPWETFKIFAKLKEENEVKSLLREYIDAPHMIKIDGRRNYILKPAASMSSPQQVDAWFNLKVHYGEDAKGNRTWGGGIEGGVSNDATSGKFEVWADSKGGKGLDIEVGPRTKTEDNPGAKNSGPANSGPKDFSPKDPGPKGK